MRRYFFETLATLLLLGGLGFFCETVVFLGRHDYLAALLREFQGNVTHAADHAGVERESLHRLLRRYRVHSEDYKP